MKKIFLLGTLFIGLSSLIVSCKKDDNGSGGSGSTTDSLHVNLSRSSVEYNGFDYATITITDQRGNDITSTSEIYVNGNYSGSKFIPTGTGTYNVNAKKGTIPSDTKVLTATAPAALVSPVNLAIALACTSSTVDGVLVLLTPSDC